MFIQLLFLLCLIIIVISLYYRYSYEGRLLDQIPGPKGLPIFGNIFDIVLHPDNLFKFARGLYKNHGDISKLYAFKYRAVNVYAPEDLEIILSATKFNEKRVPYIFLEPWLGKGLLVNNGEKWHHRRKLLTPAFHFNILKKFSQTFSEQCEELLDRLKLEIGKEQTEILPLIMKSTLRIMCETSMGTTMREDIRSVSNKYFKALFVLGQCVVYRLTRVWLYADIAFNLTKVANIQKIALQDLHKFTKQIIHERKEYRELNDNLEIIDDDRVYGKKARMAMLDMLLEQEKLGKIDEDGIREEVDTFMFEGYDTTAMALCFMIMRIANEPEIQDKIYEEMQRIFGDSDRTATVEDLTEMKYLECCIKESLRLYPSVPFIARYLCEEVELNGYKVPADTVFNIHVFDIHRREEVYPDPERFNPDRFLPENIVKRHPYSYIPFSAGPRNCIGQKFAILEIKTVMSGLLRRFRLEPVTRPEDIVFTCDIVLRSKYPIYVRFCDRKTNKTT